MRLLPMLAMGAALSSSSVATHAAIISVRLFGTASDGYDRTGLFGSIGSLTGKKFEEDFTFDTTTPGAVVNIGPNSLSIYGGPSTGPFPGNPGKASIIINGITHQIADYGTFTNETRIFTNKPIYEVAQYQVGQEFVDYAIATIDSTSIDFLKSITFANPTRYYSAVANTQVQFPGGFFDAKGLLLLGGNGAVVAEPNSLALMACFGLGAIILRRRIKA